MRKLGLMVACAFGTAMFGMGAQAMPVLQPAPTDSAIVQIAQGCGPGGHRTPYGRCVPNYRRPVYRGCPPGLHPTRFGRCRPNF